MDKEDFQLEIVYSMNCLRIVLEIQIFDVSKDIRKIIKNWTILSCNRKILFLLLILKLFNFII